MGRSWLTIPGRGSCTCKPANSNTDYHASTYRDAVIPQAGNPGPRLRRGLALSLCCAALAAPLTLGQSSSVASQSLSAARSTTRLHTFFGTTHAHTGAFNTHGEDDSTAQQVFAAARANGFDFFVLTEHTGPTGPRNPGQFFAESSRVAAAMTSGRFAPISGYEYSENRNDDDTDRGHLTVVGTEDFVNASAPGMGFATFLSYLVDQALNRSVLAGFNHPPPTGHGASRPDLLTGPTRRTIALTETHNHTTYRQTREEEYYSAMIAELDAGWRVAPTCGLDSHGVAEVMAVETADVKPCRTGVLAPSLSPARIISAMRARRVFSTRDMNLHLRYRANDRWMGAQLGTPARVEFAIRVRDPDVERVGDRITRVEVIGTGGAVLASQPVAAHRTVWRPRVRTGQNRYMLVRVFTADQPTATAVAAPIWIGAR